MLQRSCTKVSYGTRVVLSLIPWLLWAQLSSAGWELENEAKCPYSRGCTVLNSACHLSLKTSMGVAITAQMGSDKL